MGDHATPPPPTTVEQIEAQHLVHAVTQLLALPAGARRDRARRQVQHQFENLETQLGRLYRIERVPPRATMVRELAIGAVYEAHALQAVAQRDPDTHVMLLQQLGPGDEGGSDADDDTPLVFSSPLHTNDAFMMLGTD